jgi:hypothetical protein
MLGRCGTMLHGDLESGIGAIHRKVRETRFRRADAADAAWPILDG